MAKIRVQFVMTTTRLKKLQKFAKKNGYDSTADAIREAIRRLLNGQG